MATIGDAVQAIAIELERARRRLEPRRGLVSDVDTSGPLKVYTVDGHRMLSIDDSVAEGDLVFWLPGRNAVILGTAV